MSNKKAPTSSHHRRLNDFVDGLLSGEFKEIAGGLLLLLATVVSLILANGPFGESYRSFWQTPMAFTIGPYSLNLTLFHWINEGLMTLFFFVVGLEIKRELALGALSSAKKALLPLLAALGGMLAPACLFFWLNQHNPDFLDGWAIPTATDIAFVVGILTLFSRRTSASLLIFLLTLATADDLGAIIIIALFYSTTLKTSYLLFAALCCLGLALLALNRVYRVLPYTCLGCILWFCLLKGGINADLAGVITAFAIPVHGKIQTNNFVEKVRKLTKDFLHYHHDTDDQNFSRSSKQEEILYLLRKEHLLVHSPSQRLIFSLQNYTMFLIMPIYALANTALEVNLAELNQMLHSHLSLGIILGLVIGKPLGIISFSYCALKLKMASLPEDFGKNELLIAGLLGGIGFTMSLFVADLAFATNLELASLSKLAVITASTISAIIASLLIFSKKPANTHRLHID